MWLVAKEAGSSVEAEQVVFFDLRKDAEQWRRDCRGAGAYRSSPPVKIPEEIAKRISRDRVLESNIQDMIKLALKASKELE